MRHPAVCTAWTDGQTSHTSFILFSAFVPFVSLLFKAKICPALRLKNAPLNRLAHCPDQVCPSLQTACAFLPFFCYHHRKTFDTVSTGSGQPNFERHGHYARCHCRCRLAPTKYRAAKMSSRRRRTAYSHWREMRGRPPPPPPSCSSLLHRKSLPT